MAGSIAAVSTGPCAGTSFFGGDCALSDDHDPSRVRQIVAAIVLLAVLVGGGLWLTGALRGSAATQDCLASGRTNCAPVRG